MKILKQKKFNSAINYIKVIGDDTLVVADFHSVMYLNIQTLRLIKGGFKIDIPQDKNGLDLIDFSNAANCFVLGNPDSKEARVYNTESKRSFLKLDKHKHIISAVAIDPHSQLVFSGGDDGKTFGMEINSLKLACILPTHKDTVTDIAFSSDSQWVATASYDKTISLYDLFKMTPSFQLTGHSAPVMKLLFYDDYTLVSVDRNSVLIIWDVKTGKTIKVLHGISDDIKCIVKADGFIFMGTALGYILIYNMKVNKLMDDPFVKLKDSIRILAFDDKEKHLIVGTKSGDMLYYDIYEGRETVSELFKEKRYQQMYECFDRNPLLKCTKPHDALERIWNLTMRKAKDLLMAGKENMALDLFHDFKDIPMKKQYIKKIMEEYVGYNQFITYIKQDKLALAYGLAKKYPEYKESNEYRIMDAQWKKVFLYAQKLLWRSNTQAKIKEILAPYKGIPEKSKIINEMMKNTQVYERFRKYLSQKDFKIALNLAHQYQFLTETGEYANMMKFAQKLYIQSHELMKNAEVESAQKMLQILQYFDDYKEEALERLEDIQNREGFYNAIEDFNLLEAYNYLEKSKCLLNTDDGKRLEARWVEDVEVANFHASKADVEDIIDLLDKYLKINSKFFEISKIFALCYINELENALKNKKSQKAIESGIKKYVEFFGNDSEILNFYDKFNKSFPEAVINFDRLKQGSNNTWKPTMIVNSILG
jgi:hypothetical protein